MPKKVPCQVCSSLENADLIEFNLMLADPAEWPKTVFEDWDLPKGTLPARMRSWGGARYGRELLAERGITVSDAAMTNHFARHVPHLATTPAQLEEIGRMLIDRTAGVGGTERSLVPTIRPRMFTDYYSTAIQLGLYALEETRRRIEETVKQGGVVEEKTLWKLADLGAKIAMSQAALMARHAQGQESDDELRGFRDGSAPLPSERFGDHRIRVIDGKAQPVVDRGKADRDHYNERADQEGSPRVGGR